MGRKSRINKEHQVSKDYGQRFYGIKARGRSIFRAVVIALAVLGASGIVHAQENQQDQKPEINISRSIPSPVTSDTIMPPAGNTAFLLGHGVGTQGYVCLPTATGGEPAVGPVSITDRARTQVSR